MQLKLWKNFSKRRNSTKRPADADAVVEIVRLKNATSIENPVFVILGNDFEFNYAQAFGHYYYINDIVSLNNNMCELHCSQDLLATYKNNILGTTAFVEYAAMGYNTKLPDRRVAVQSSEYVSESSLTIGQFSEVGTYVLSVATDSPAAGGFVTTYLLDSSTMIQLAGYLLRDIFDTPTAQQTWEYIQKTFAKAYDSIISCIWIPVDLATASAKATLAPLKIGKDEIEISGVVVTAYKVNDKTPIDISNVFVTIPYAYDDFRRAEPFTKLSLYLPYYGIVQLNPIDFPESVNVILHIDILTGDITAEIKNNALANSAVITTINYNIGINCPISQTSSNTSGGVTSIAGGIGGAIGAIASSGATAVLSTIGAVVATANGVVDLTRVSTSVKGNIQGNSMYSMKDIKLIVKSIDTTDPEDLLTIAGRPVMTTRSLANHSGYIKTVQASVNISGLGNDKEALNSMLDAGIYIE